MEQQYNVHKMQTPMGELVIESGETKFGYYTAVALVRPNGEIIDLSDTEIVKSTNDAKVYVWENTKTDEWTHCHTIRKEDLITNEE